MEIPVPIRELIIKLRKDGKSLRVIAGIVNKSRSTVQYIINKYQQTNSLENRKRTGRPTKLEHHHERAILKVIRSEPKTSARKLANMIHNDYGVKVVPQTIRNVLKKSGYNGRTARRKPFISKINKQKRMDFAKAHMYRPREFWNSVIFSDECKFNLFGSDGRVKIWRMKNTEMECKNLRATVKHGGGSIMVWGCMNAAGTGNLVFIDGIMDQDVYLNILKDNLDYSARKLGLDRRFIFQQDNDPKHTARRVKEWLLYNTPKQLHTPPQSPDINPIEHLWDEIKRRLQKHNIKNKTELKNAILLEWNSITSDVTEKLINSMQKRMFAIHKAKGGPTTY